MAISLVNAATTDLNDLISRLDLSATPECSPAKGFTPRLTRGMTISGSPVPSLPDDIRKWNWGPFKSTNLSSSHLPPPPAPTDTLTAPVSATSTFGRNTVRPQFPEDRTPPSRLSTQTVDTFDGDSSFTVSYDSPLKNRGKKQSGGSMLTVVNKGSNGTMLGGYRSAKVSTGTMLSAFGVETSSNPAHLSIASEVVGDVSLEPFGRGRTELAAPCDEEDANSDIPDELQELLSCRSDTGSSVDDEGRAGFYNISIPDSASALMSNTHLESLFRPTHSRAHSGSSLPPGPAPALPLPERPNDSSRFSRATSSSYAGDYDEHTMSSADSKSTMRSDQSSIIVGDGVHRASTAGLHDGPAALEQLEEEDSPSHSDTDLTDHTGKTSFDFTKELDRLNEGGSRMSFVAQLENAFKTPVRSSYHSAEDMPPIPALGLHSMLAPKEQVSLDLRSDSIINTDSASQQSTTTANAPAQNGHKRGSEVFQSFSSNSTAYAIANLDLSLVHPVREPKTSSATIVATEPVQNSPKPKKPEHVRAASLSDSLDASMAALANLNLSLVHPSKPRPHSTSLESNTTSKRHARIAKARAQRRVLVSQNSSVLSTSSFGSVRNPGVPDPFEYGVAPAPAADPSGHGRNESMTSIPSISSYGVLLNSGVKNPFGYDATRSSRFTSEADRSSSIPDVPQGHRQRYSVDSDRSSFFFNSNASRHQRRGNWREDSIISFTSGSAPPPLSFLNQSARTGHDRTDSILSGNSVAYAYGAHGAYGGRAAWARHRHDPSRDSILSDFSTSRLGRPGLGDKMFESNGDYPALYSIAASPTSSSPGMSYEVGRGGDDRSPRHSFDSVGSRFDDKASSVDSIFDKTGSISSSISSGSVFNTDDSRPSLDKSILQMQQAKQFRPISMYSTISMANGSVRDDDTMISMLGGEHAKVPRTALGSSFNSSPCVRAEKKRKRMFTVRRDSGIRMTGSPRATQQASLSATPTQMKNGRISPAPSSLLEREHVQESCLDGEGDEFTTTGKFALLS